jgi:hypothetical protein
MWLTDKIRAWVKTLRALEGVKVVDAGVIVLLSDNSLAAEGQQWEIKGAREEEAALLGVYIHNSATSYPSEMNGVNKIEWNWDGMASVKNALWEKCCPTT